MPRGKSKSTISDRSSNIPNRPPSTPTENEDVFADVADFMDETENLGAGRTPISSKDINDVMTSINSVSRSTGNTGNAGNSHHHSSPSSDNEDIGNDENDDNDEDHFDAPFDGNENDDEDIEPIVGNIPSVRAPVAVSNNNNNGLRGKINANTRTDRPAVKEVIPIGSSSSPAVPAVKTQSATGAILHTVPKQSKTESPNLHPGLGVYVDDDALDESSFTVPTLPTLMRGDDYVYKNVYAVCRIFVGDTYSPAEVIDASYQIFGMHHLLMDFIRASAKLLINVPTDRKVDFRDILDSNGDRTTYRDLEGFRASTMSKRIGKARIQVSAHYGFNVPGIASSIKIIVYEHSDPIDVFEHALMQILKIMEIERQNHIKTTIPKPDLKVETDEEIIICDGDEDAVDAPFDSLVDYKATLMKRVEANECWSFYMPTRAAWSEVDLDNIQGSKGIYIYYEKDPVLQKAVQSGEVDNIGYNEFEQVSLHIIARKRRAKSGNPLWELIRIEPEFADDEDGNA